MTPFEIIILIIIYMFCYGYVFAIFLNAEETSITFRVCMAIGCLIFAFIAPIIVGGMIFEEFYEKYY